MHDNIYKELEAPFSNKDVEWKPQLSGTDRNGRQYIIAVPYLKAKSIVKRLDSVLGKSNWQNYFQKSDDTYICTIALNVDGAWIKKSNGAGPTPYEAIKGGLSDAFKRAATMWGIGSYLQEMQTQFVYEVKQSRNKLVIDEQAAMPKLNAAHDNLVLQCFGNTQQSNVVPLSKENTTKGNIKYKTPDMKQFVTGKTYALGDCTVLSVKSMPHPKLPYTILGVVSKNGTLLNVYINKITNLTPNTLLKNVIVNVREKKGKKSLLYEYDDTLNKAS